MVASGVLGALAFNQGTQGWYLVGAVLTGLAIGDAMVLTIASVFRWRHRDEWGKD
jgi:hypothetical protein